jgi:hypothetical protein
MKPDRADETNGQREGTGHRAEWLVLASVALGLLLVAAALLHG